MKRSQSVVRNRPKTIGTCLGEIAMKITTTVFYVWANRSPTPYKGRGAEGHKKPPGAKIRHLWPFTSLFGVISSHKVWYHWSIYCWSLFWVFTRIGLDKEYSLSKPKNKKPRKKKLEKCTCCWYWGTKNFTIRKLFQKGRNEFRLHDFHYFVCPSVKYMKISHNDICTDHCWADTVCRSRVWLQSGRQTTL